MGVIKNFQSLTTSPERKIIIDLIETAFAAIRPTVVMQNNFSLKDHILHIKTESFDLKKYKRVFVVGFGKGSAGICQIIEQTLGDYLTDGYDIDNVAQKFSKIHFTLGTHPLPSLQNIQFTQHVLDSIDNLTKEDLVLVVICGGGSAMFEVPHKASLETLDAVSKALLRSGATISQLNVIRKHMSKVKGGDFAKHLYPATVASLMFSDVPGSNLSVIASGPTVKDTTTLQEAEGILQKYKIAEVVPEIEEKGMLWGLPHEDKYFENVHNFLIVSNTTALEAMQAKAKELGYIARIYSDKIQGDAKVTGKMLLEQTHTGEILLAGGETTVHVSGSGKGGRNQALVLAVLASLDTNTTIASFDTDGIDFYYFAGAIGDSKTLQKAKELGLDPQEFLDNDNSYEFFKKTGDGIYTDKLESNVSDLMIVLKK